MPELPEVETVRAGLAPAVVGRRLERVEIRDARLTRPEDPLVVAAELVGERVAALERRGKYLVFWFESGRVLLVHLRMTGGFRLAAGNGLPDDPYVRAVVTLDDGSDVAYRDVRRFGTWQLLEPYDAEPFLDARLGEEPLGRRFTARTLQARLASRRAPIKAALLDQRTIAGMGNIYVDEALWRARIHPLRPARDLDRDDVKRLHRAVRRAPEAGLARQGATIRNYATPDGGSGAMQHEFKVYGRGGEPCLRCGTPIRVAPIGVAPQDRVAFYCPHCQRGPAPTDDGRPQRPLGAFRR